MKQGMIVLLLAVLFAGSAMAQVSKKAIGVRLGGGFGGGAEVSYQHPLSAEHRLEFGLGGNVAGFGASCIYHWVEDLSDLGEGFNWYYGVGGGLGSYDFNKSGLHQFNAGILGQIGLEYNFEIPLMISIDYRPGIYISNGFSPSYDGICASVRYKF